MKTKNKYGLQSRTINERWLFKTKREAEYQIAKTKQNSRNDRVFVLYCGVDYDATGFAISLELEYTRKKI